MRRAVAVAVGVPLLAALAAGAVVTSLRPQVWREGSVHGRWRTVFSGYGTVTGDDFVVRLAPRTAQGRDRTHAALVTTTDEYRDLALSASVLTEAQLRPERPNAWEVGWLLWRYRDPGRFYAVALKPNGWEISKQDPAYPRGQRFLASAASPTFAVGEWHTVSVVQTGDRLKVSADGRLLAALSDVENPYLTGAVGLYCEDARVRFRDVRITTLPSGSEPEEELR